MRKERIRVKRAMELALEHLDYIIDHRTAPDFKSNVAYDCDILANAKGYEFLAEQMLRKQRAA